MESGQANVYDYNYIIQIMMSHEKNYLQFVK